MISPEIESRLKRLNQLLNRAARTINYVSVELANVNLKQIKKNNKKIANVVETLNDLQREIYAINPELEYHYDPSREETNYMQQIFALTNAAKEFERKGDKASAIQKLMDALETDPPPLTYEALEKEIARLRR